MFALALLGRDGRSARRSYVLDGCVYEKQRETTRNNAKQRTPLSNLHCIHLRYEHTRQSTQVEKSYSSKSGEPHADGRMGLRACPIIVPIIRHVGHVADSERRRVGHLVIRKPFPCAAVRENRRGRRDVPVNQVRAGGMVDVGGEVAVRPRVVPDGVPALRVFRRVLSVYGGDVAPAEH